MTKIQGNKHLLGVISEIKSNCISRDTIFILPEKGLCNVVANTSSQGDSVAIFETADGKSVFHYNIVDAILENQDAYPIGEVFWPFNTSDSDRTFIVLARSKYAKEYLCKSIKEEKSTKRGTRYSFFSRETIEKYIILEEQAPTHPRNIFDWIKSHDPEYSWDFSNPEITKKHFLQAIQESGDLDLKSLLRLINEYFNNVPLLDKDHRDNFSVYDKWINWSKN